MLAGGGAVDRPGWFYQPTLLSGLTDDMRIVMEETFGPVASLYKVADRDEAIRVANQTTFGLSSAVWTQDADEEAAFIRDLEAGAGLHQRHDGLVPGAAVRRHQGLRIRPRAGRGGHPRVLQREDGLEGVTARAGAEEPQ